LAIGPWVFDFGEAVFDVVFVADPVKDMIKRAGVVSHVRELDAVVGQDRMNVIGNSGLLPLHQSYGIYVVDFGCCSAHRGPKTHKD
jgi:hypothetical protein